MRYLFLAYGNEQQWSALSVSERNALENAHQTNDEMLRQSSHLLAVETLRSNATSTLVQIQDGQLYLTDGLLAAACPQLLAFYVISARDLNEAIRVASTLPQAHVGPIEVRPLITPKI